MFGSSENNKIEFKREIKVACIGCQQIKKVEIQSEIYDSALIQFDFSHSDKKTEELYAESEFFVINNVTWEKIELTSEVLNSAPNILEVNLLELPEEGEIIKVTAVGYFNEELTEKIVGQVILVIK